MDSFIAERGRCSNSRSQRESDEPPHDGGLVAWTMMERSLQSMNDKSTGDSTREERERPKDQTSDTLVDEGQANR